MSSADYPAAGGRSERWAGSDLRPEWRAAVWSGIGWIEGPIRAHSSITSYLDGSDKARRLPRLMHAITSSQSTAKPCLPMTKHGAPDKTWSAEHLRCLTDISQARGFQRLRPRLFSNSFRRPPWGGWGRQISTPPYPERQDLV